MSCTNKKFVVKEIIITSDTGLQGPTGPQGPPGPPGPVPDAYPADQVTVTNVGFNNVQEVLDALLYVRITIDSFSGGPTQYEIGRTLTSITFDWTLNKNIISQTLTGPPEMTSVVLTPSQRSVTVILANLTVDASFTLTVNDGTPPLVDSVFNIAFVNRIYIADVDAPGVIDDAWVLGLPSILTDNRVHTYTLDAIGTQFNWYILPKDYGVPTFNVEGVQGGYHLEAELVDFTNNFGHDEDYDVYRTDFPGVGPGLTTEVT